jgi:hypothetical protein
MERAMREAEEDKEEEDEMEWPEAGEDGGDWKGLVSEEDSDSGMDEDGYTRVEHDEEMDGGSSNS